MISPSSSAGEEGDSSEVVKVPLLGMKSLVGDLDLGEDRFPLLLFLFFSSPGALPLSCTPRPKSGESNQLAGCELL